MSGFIGSGPVGSLAIVDSIDNVSGLQTALDAKTTESYVDTQITAVVGAAPAALNTLQELGDALGDDANFAVSVTTSLAGKVDDSQVLTNVPASAVFTDTVYSKPSTEPISYVTGLQTALDDKYTEDDYIADEMVDMGWAR